MIILFGVAAYFCCLYLSVKKDINRLNEIQREEEAYLATVVHDLKTPNNSQLSTLKMLNKGMFGLLNPQQQEMISLLLDSCTYMTNLIEMIMKVHCDFGKIKLEKSLFEPSKLVMDLCSEIKNLCTERNQTISFNNLAQGCVLYADYLQLKRVILNLLSNAVKYAYLGTNIEITIKESDNSFECFVENYSRQISKEELAKVFDKYSKTEYSCFNGAGSGLGLYLVKQIIELHNGRVYAKSEVNGKCTFGFVIPNYRYKNNKRHGFYRKKFASFNAS